jgi:putative ABC transport system permease protein
MGNFFDLLGVRPVLGRAFREVETWAEGNPRVAVLTWRAWRDVFGSDPGIVGRSLRLDGRDVEVIGVLPQSFALPGIEAEVWLPTRWNQAQRSAGFFRRAHWIHPIARLKPGVSFDNADRELRTVMKRLEQQYPATNTHMGAGLTPLHDFLIGSARLPLIVMFSAVGVLLLIACANIANLLLVRAGGQEREAALRLALGAGRGRLLRRALAETVILSGLGGAFGLLLGWWGTRTLAALQPQGILPVAQVPFGWSVLLYGFVAVVIAATLFSLAPVMWTARRTPADVLRDESRSASAGQRVRRWGEVLLVGQVTLALALSLGAGLLVRSFLRLQRVDPGFEPRGVLAVELGLPGSRYDSVRKVLAFYQELEQRVRAQPGVEATAIVSGVPLGPPMWTSGIGIAGRAPVAGQVHHREISPEYQRVMKVPLRRGRLLTSADGAGGPYVVLVNETLVRRYFPDRDPIGQQIVFDKIPDSTSTWRTIVGVVGDERIGSLSALPEPEVLAPFPQEPRNGMTLVVRTRTPGGLGPSVRRIIAELEPSLAITSMRTMEEVRALALARDRFMTVLLLSFAGVGVLLGIVGIYGVVSQLARRRTREMGIRIALGSDTRQVQWLVLRRGLWLTGLGIVGGVSLAIGLTGAIRTLLYEITPLDPLTFGLVPALVLLTALVASWLPARRASRADPCDCLRTD